MFGRRTAQDEREVLGISIAKSVQIESIYLNSSRREERLSVRLKARYLKKKKKGGSNQNQVMRNENKSGGNRTQSPSITLRREMGIGNSSGGMLLSFSEQPPPPLQAPANHPFLFGYETPGVVVRPFSRMG